MDAVAEILSRAPALTVVAGPPASGKTLAITRAIESVSLKAIYVDLVACRTPGEQHDLLSRCMARRPRSMEAMFGPRTAAEPTVLVIDDIDAAFESNRRLSATFRALYTASSPPWRHVVIATSDNRHANVLCKVPGATLVRMPATSSRGPLADCDGSNGARDAVRRVMASRDERECAAMLSPHDASCVMAMLHENVLRRSKLGPDVALRVHRMCVSTAVLESRAFHNQDATMARQSTAIATAFILAAWRRRAPPSSSKQQLRPVYSQAINWCGAWHVAIHHRHMAFTTTYNLGDAKRRRVAAGTNPFIAQVQRRQTADADEES